MIGFVREQDKANQESWLVTRVGKTQLHVGHLTYRVGSATLVPHKK